jgi:hypothetical protein
MNTIGINPVWGSPVAADTLGAAIITTAGAVVAQDWSSGAGMVHFNVHADSWCNFWSTSVNIPTTNSAGTTVSSGQNVLLKAGHEHVYQIPGVSTGYSLTAATSGVISIELWKK